MDNATELVFTYIYEIFETINGILEEMEAEDRKSVGFSGRWKERMYDENGQILMDSQLLSFLIVLADSWLKDLKENKIGSDGYGKLLTIAAYYEDPGLTYEECPAFPVPPTPRKSTSPSVSKHCAIRSGCTVVGSALYEGLDERIYCFGGVSDMPPVSRTLKSIRRTERSEEDSKDASRLIYGYVIYAFWVMAQLYQDNPKWFYFSLRSIINQAGDGLDPWLKCCLKPANDWVEEILPKVDIPHLRASLNHDYVKNVAHSCEYAYHLVYVNDILYGASSTDYNRYKAEFNGFIDLMLRSVSSFESCAAKEISFFGVRDFLRSAQITHKHQGMNPTTTTYQNMFGYVCGIFLSLIELMRSIGAGALNTFYKKDIRRFKQISLASAYEANLIEYSKRGFKADHIKKDIYERIEQYLNALGDKLHIS